jgi:hypothetical protein
MIRTLQQGSCSMKKVGERSPRRWRDVLDRFREMRRETEEKAADELAAIDRRDRPAYLATRINYFMRRDQWMSTHLDDALQELARLEAMAEKKSRSSNKAS